jgi:hypothetical protein
MRFPELTTLFPAIFAGRRTGVLAALLFTLPFTAVPGAAEEIRCDLNAAYGPIQPAAGACPLGETPRRIRKNLKLADRYGYVPKYYGSAPTGYIWPIYGSRAPHAAEHYFRPPGYLASPYAE